MTPEESCQFRMMDLRIEQLEERLSRLDRPAPPCSTCQGKRFIWDREDGNDIFVGCPKCNPEPKFVKPPDPKPLRLLVEVVPKKDEKHDYVKYNDNTVSIFPTYGAKHFGGMSVRMLPQIPTLEDLTALYKCEWIKHPSNPEGVRRGIALVLRACGLEVSE